MTGPQVDHWHAFGLSATALNPSATGASLYGFGEGGGPHSFGDGSVSVRVRRGWRPLTREFFDASPECGDLPSQHRMY